MKKLFYILISLLLAFSIVFVFSCKKTGGGVTLKYNNGTEPETLDPAVMSGHPEMMIAYQLFEGLVSYDSKANPVPGVAEKWDVSEDKTVYTFHLRKNVKWSDGQPVTADDFYFAWLRAMKSETGGDYAFLYWDYIKGAQDYADGKVTEADVGLKVIDKYTFQVTLNAPTPYILDIFAFPTFMPVPKHVVEKVGNDTWFKKENIVTNGAYLLKEWIPQQKIVMEKNKAYWDAKNVKVEILEFYAIEEATTALEMYLNGELDILNTVPTERIDEMKTRDDYHQVPEFATYYYIINVKANKALADVRVRKALAMAIDREYIVNYITKSGQIPAYSFVPEGLTGYKGPKFDKGDLDTARKLLAEAGYPNGKGFPKITILYNTSEGHRKIAEAIQQMWSKELGIKVELLNQEWKVYLDSRDNHQFDVARAGWIGDYLDPKTFLDMFITGASFNNGQWSNPKYDKLVKAALNEFDVTKRYQLFAEAEKILLDEMPIIPIYYYSTVYMVKPYVKGYDDNLRDLHPFKYVYFEKK